MLCFAHLFVRRAGGNLAAIRAEPNAVDEVGVLVVVGVIHLEGGSLVEQRPRILTSRHDAVRPARPIVTADDALAVTHNLRTKKLFIFTYFRHKT